MLLYLSKSPTDRNLYLPRYSGTLLLAILCQTDQLGSNIHLELTDALYIK